MGDLKFQLLEDSSVPHIISNQSSMGRTGLDLQCELGQNYKMLGTRTRNSN